MYVNRWFLNVLSHGVMMPTTQTLSLETSHGMYVIQLMYDVCIDLYGGVVYTSCLSLLLCKYYVIYIHHSLSVTSCYFQG